MTRGLLEVAVLQAAWFAAVLGAGQGRPWLGPPVAAAAVVLHLALSGDRRRALRDLILTAAAGCALEAAMVAAGVLHFAASPERLHPLPPPWIAGLWLAFACALRTSLSWLRGRWILAATLAALGGPAGYLAGEGFGAVAFPSGLAAAMIPLALAWAVGIPILLRITAPEKGARGRVLPEERNP